MKSVTSTINSSLPSGQGLSAQTEANTFDDMVDAFKVALNQVKVEMDDEEMGRFVDKVVTKLVYS
jgi:hypothetical protein